jgi:GntR family transcriptional regulator
MAKQPKTELALDPDSPTPAYRQIADLIRSQLVFHEIAVGATLPPGRELARDLGVHHNTVAQAYRQLAAEGLVELKRKTGAKVLQRIAPAASPDVTEYYRRRLRSVVAAMWSEGVQAEEIRAELKAMAAEF